jgi:hypothetical protein
MDERTLRMQAVELAIRGLQKPTGEEIVAAAKIISDFIANQAPSTSQTSQYRSDCPESS